MIDIILFAAFAVFIGFKLFNALGRRDFDNQQPKARAQDNIVNFPAGENSRVVDAKFEEIKDDYEELEKKYGAEIAAQIKEIRKIDKSFNEKDFASGVKMAFEMILGAFARGDKNTLKPLLSKEIYEGFSAEIDRREKSDEVEETTLVAVLKTDVKDIKMASKWNARIAVEIVSEQIRLVKDKQGKILHGDPSHVDKVAELWTFSRNLTSPNPNWELVDTGHTA